jgi:antibiotic biosynthesis monooxygenase (ABM) superfamily enzyme
MSCSAPAASRTRLALVLCLGAYPLITSLLYLWAPVLSDRPTWMVTAVIVPQMVAGMVWGVIPLAHRWFGWFIRRCAA